MQISVFITPHGFGHATRAIAVLDALSRRIPKLSIRLLTSVPHALFRESLSNFDYHELKVDVGLVQASALEIDFPASLSALKRFYPFRTNQEGLAKHNDLCTRAMEICRGSGLILCDIAPMGIEVAGRLGIPSVLVENFTWDWIYTPYCPRYPELAAIGDYLHKLFSTVDYRIQTEPLCAAEPCALHCGPIYRKSRGLAADYRDEFLQKPAHETNEEADKDKRRFDRIVLVSMGGVAQELPQLDRLRAFHKTLFLFAGQPPLSDNDRAALRLVLPDNVRCISRNAPFYHPDLIGAADVVVCKAGYSTIAECYQAGSRVISIGRENFPESAALQEFIRKELNGITLNEEQYTSGEWLDAVAKILQTTPPTEKSCPSDGAEEVARLIEQLLTG